MYNDNRLQNLWTNGQYNLTAEPINDIVLTLRERFAGSDSNVLKAVKQNWQQIVGDELFDLCFPSRIQSDILKIAASTATVKFALEQMYRQTVLDHIRDLTGKRLKDLKCIVDTD